MGWVGRVTSTFPVFERYSPHIDAHFWGGMLVDIFPWVAQTGPTMMVGWKESTPARAASPE